MKCSKCGCDVIHDEEDSDLKIELEKLKSLLRNAEVINPSRELYEWYGQDGECNDDN